MNKITRKIDNSTDYTCWKCGNMWVDEKKKEPYNCPKCGSYKISFKFS